MRFTSFIIVLFVAYMTGYALTYFVDMVWSYKTNNLENISYQTHSCTPFASADSDRQVVLRIDDIQGEVWSDISVDMIRDATKRNMRVVLGIIPDGILADHELPGYIRKKMCYLEVAQHGWKHHVNGDYDEPEFGSLDKKEAQKKFKRGIKKLEKLTKDDIITFIPPQNIMSDGAREAAHDAGIRVISADGKGKFDLDVSPFNWDTFELVPVDEVMRQCEEVFQTEKTCILMLHPQDYATDGKLDEDKYELYLELLNEIEKNNITTVTFKELQ